MPIPTQVTDMHNSIAREVARSITQIHAMATTARASLQTQRLDLVGLYRQVLLFLGQSAQLQAAGFTPSMVGPIIENIYGIDWTTMETDYVSLRDVEFPALRDAIAAAQNEIVVGRLDPTDGHIILDGPLQAATLADLQAKIDAVLARFS